ncbi:uncharacterized protein [Typha latifolia]|uniref:uncharacterized protein isoform X1 n=1 Tax=Typha latifolia TaxID=4733 RepID=UPI003C2BFF8C
MPTESRAEHDETVAMQYNAQVRWNNSRHQFARVPKEMVLSSRVSTITKYQDKEGALERRMLSEQAVPDRYMAERCPFQPASSRSHKKPWPRRKANGVDDLVKHMSKVPSYLRSIERGDTAQEKALKVGVLDWCHLESWSNHKKPVTSGSDTNSPSSSNDSSLSSTFGSSAQSCESTDKPLLKRMQSHFVDSHQHPSIIGKQTQLLGKQSDNVTQFGNLETSSAKFPAADNGIGYDELVHNDEKGKSPEHEAISYDASRPPNFIFSTSRDIDASTFAGKLVGAQDSRREREEKVQQCARNLYVDRDWTPNNCFILSKSSEYIWDHLQQSVHVRRCSFESPVSNDGGQTERNNNCFSADFPGDVHLIKRSYIPHSCPLPQTTLTDAPEHSSNCLTENTSGGNEAKREIRKKNILLASTANRKSNGRTSGTAAKELRNDQSSSGLNRMSWNSSLREKSSVRQLESIVCADKFDGDRECSNNRGRRSPLRRILDPLLRPKNHISLSGPIAESSNHCSELSNASNFIRLKEMTSSNGPRSSVDESIDPTCQSRRNLSTSRLVSTKQALLRLNWKNGLPLFMLSSGNSDILAATVRKKSISNKDDFECIYTIFTVQESKKKSGAWIKPGNKSKKHQLISSIIGEIKVSLSKTWWYDSKYDHDHVVRQFVLFGNELTPTSHRPVSSQFKSEFAAILVKGPQDMIELSNGGASYSSKHGNLKPKDSVANTCSLFREKTLQTEQSNDYSNLANVVVILPSGIHGCSDSGEPSSLIERWNSGICDCGGWDEGCKLSTLTDEFLNYKSPDSVQICTQQLELFFQGQSQESGHAFRMVSFKEGVYIVEFQESIAVVQAFATCIAKLHNVNPTRQQLGVHALQEDIFAADERKASARINLEVPASYVPNHPPLSPVGRA